MKKIIFIITFFVFNILFSQSDYKKIIAENTSKHDYSNFDSIAKKMGFKGGDSFKIITMFSLNHKGEIVNIKARGPYRIFENEAIKVVKLLPKMDPPKNLKEGEFIKFTLPITMVIETDAEKRKRKRKELRRKKKKLKNNHQNSSLKRG